MNTLLTFVSDTALQALGWTLVHFLWQGIVVFLLLGSTVQVLRLQSAQARYVTSCVALLLMLVLPLATFRAELGDARERQRQRGDIRNSVAALQEEPAAPQPRLDATASSTRRAVREAPRVVPAAQTLAAAAIEPHFVPAGDSHAAHEAPAVATVPSAPTDTSWMVRLRVDAFLQRVEAFLPWLVAVWLAGVAFLMARLITCWSHAQRLRMRGLRAAPRALELAIEQLSHRLGVRQVVGVFESALAEVPTVVGWLKPVVLVPTSALAGLTPRQLEAILAHELAHVRRHDYIVNLMQTVVETLLFYHPAVWWISERIRDEREHCCDDLAVQTCGDRFGYVRALTALEELRNQPSTARVAMAADGGSLLARVRRLVGRRDEAAASPARGIAGFLAVATVFVLGVGMQRAGEAGAETEPWNSQTAPAPTAAQASAAPPASPSDVSAHLQPEHVLGQRSARKGEAQPASQLRGPARRTSSSEHPATPDQHGEPVEAHSAHADAEHLSVRQLLALRQAGVDGAYLDTMHALGIEDVDQLIQLRRVGVDAEFIRSMRAAGFDAQDIESLVQLRRQGVDAVFVAAIEAAGLDDLQLDDAILLRQNGVDASFVLEIQEFGFSELEVDELVALRRNGVDPTYIEFMREATGEDLELEDYVQLRRQGVDPAYVEFMRDVWEDLEIDELVDLRRNGVDPVYVDGMQRVFPDVDPDDLVRLRQQGVEADYVESLREAGFEDLDSDAVIQLRRRGVKPSDWPEADEDTCLDDDFDADWDSDNRSDNASGRDDTYVAAMRDRDFDALDRDVLAELREQGVSARYVAEMVQAGLEPSPDVLLHLRENGVRPTHIRAIRDGDASALTVNDLVRLKNAGIDGSILDRLQEAKR